VWAILTTLFCCLPAGIVSIVYAAQVNSKWTGGDYRGAFDSSRNARTWAIVSAVVGLIAIVLIVIVRASAANNGATTP
jgi:t-SNARE complex subunit (syntaxin)